MESVFDLRDPGRSGLSGRPMPGNSSFGEESSSRVERDVAVTVSTNFRGIGEQATQQPRRAVAFPDNR